MILNVNAMIERIMQWSNVNSGSYHFHGLEKMSHLIIQAFSELECHHNQIPLPSIEILNNKGEKELHPLGPLLSFQKRPEAPFQILLMGHMDTVFDQQHTFQKAYRKDNNILIGPGVADMKGGICIMLEALKALENAPFAKRIGWEVLINPDEEIGSLGSAPFIAERAKKNQVGLIFEPAMDDTGTLAYDRKGSAKFTILAKGKAAHAGRDFHLGKNAIVALSEVVKEVNALNGQREGVTVNVGFITGGGAVNIVPALALSRLDVRFQKSKDGEWIEEEINKIVNKTNEREGVTITLSGGITRQPKTIDKKTHALYELVERIGKDLGQKITWKNSGGTSDGNNLFAAGLPNIDTLGVYGGHIHSSEEFLLIDSLLARTHLTFNILKYFSEFGFSLVE